MSERITIASNIMNDSEFFLAANPTDHDRAEAAEDGYYSDGHIGGYLVLCGGAVQCIGTFDDLRDAVGWLYDD